MHQRYLDFKENPNDFITLEEFENQIKLKRKSNFSY